MRARWDIFFRTTRTVKPIQKPPARFHFPCTIQRKSGETLRLQYITLALILQYLLQDFYLSILFLIKRVSNKSENGCRHLVRVGSCGTHPPSAFADRAAIRHDGSGHASKALFRCTVTVSKDCDQCISLSHFQGSRPAFQTRSA